MPASAASQVATTSASVCGDAGAGVAAALAATVPAAGAATGETEALGHISPDKDSAPAGDRIAGCNVFRAEKLLSLVAACAPQAAAAGKYGCNVLQPGADREW